MVAVVDQYLHALATHDWPALRATLADDGLVRIGPFCDRIEGAERYVEYLRETVPALRGWGLQVRRRSAVEGRVFVELTETVEVDGRVVGYPECILFEVDDSGRIQHVSVFMMVPPGG